MSQLIHSNTYWHLHTAQQLLLQLATSSAANVYKMWCNLGICGTPAGPASQSAD